MEGGPSVEVMIPASSFRQGSFFEYMFRASKDHTLPAVNLVYSPLFIELREDPRFKELLNSAGIAIPSLQT